MTSKELKEAINAHLFVPISEELAGQLLEVAKVLVSEMGMEELDNYSRSFFLNRISPSFKGQFLAQYKDTYGEGLHLPSVVIEILEICVVLLMLESDAVDANMKGKASLIVRNNAILRKGDWTGVLCPEWIEKMYAVFPSKGSKAYKGPVTYETLIKTIVPQNTWSETGLDANDQNVYNQLRSLCTSVVRGRLGAYPNKHEFNSISSPFAQVYVLVEKMVRTWQWKYIDDSPVKRIMEVMGEKTKKRKMMGGIIEEVKTQVPNITIFAPKEKSSILLARINDDKKSILDNRMFNVLEFGVYLYYEMLLETYND